MPDKESKNMKVIVAAVPRKANQKGPTGWDSVGGEAEAPRSWWTKIGVAFENKDGSWNLRFDFLPTSAETTIQLREFEPKREAAAE